MREFSSRPAKTDSSGRPENDQKTLQWAPNVRDSTNFSHHKSHQALNTSVSSPPSRHRQKAIGYSLFVDPTDNKRMSPSLPRWLVSCGKKTIDPDADDYHVESWSSFHNKYSSHSYRAAHNMTFSEIRKQQRRKVTPSLTERIVQRLGGQANQCVHCGAAQCDGTCSIYSTPSSKKHSGTPKKRQSLSPFRRKQK